MFGRLFSGTAVSYLSLFTLATISHASPSESLTVDVYGSSYSVELDHEATDRVLRSQPWWGNKELASELCEALVYEGEDIASVGFNTLAIGGENFIEAYLVMPSAICSGPVLISQEDIGEMTGGTFFVVSGNGCLTSTAESLSALGDKNQGSFQIYQNFGSMNCGYFNTPTLH
ncbi:MAG: hypothetical protein ACFB14_01820 [Leptolyngbyaceae cyanobacterium]